MLHKILKAGCILITVIIIIPCCKKYLDAKPDKQLEIPSTTQDMQALLDNFRKMNQNDPSGGEISCDNYYLTDASWNSLTTDMQRIYLWQNDFLFTAYPNMWSNAYDAIYIPNTVLDYLSGIKKTNDNADEWDDIKGQALYFRAKEFHQVACTWALAWNSVTASTDLGIPLRLNSDFNSPSERGTLEETYDQIISDLKESIPLLPVMPVSVYRPSRPAAYGLLARVYLSMRKYELAGSYADSCLQLNNSLMDYNTLRASATWPIAAVNVETIMYSSARNWGPLSNSGAKIDSVLYASYDSNDLRKTIFFKNNNNGTYGFKGTYTGGSAQFSGIATDEVYLVKAECEARGGNINGAMDDLNTLLITRWKQGTFVPFTAANVSDALNLILTERRKELLYRELRWMDIKRLNKEGANIMLKRIINGQTYILPSNDPRYALALPEDIIQQTGMQQNPR